MWRQTREEAVSVPQGEGIHQGLTQPHYSMELSFKTIDMYFMSVNLNNIYDTI